MLLGLTSLLDLTERREPLLDDDELRRLPEDALLRRLPEETLLPRRDGVEARGAVARRDESADDRRDDELNVLRDDLRESLDSDGCVRLKRL